MVGTTTSVGLTQALGVIGEYLVRVLREVRGAPRYVERESLGGPPAGNTPGDGPGKPGTPGATGTAP